MSDELAVQSALQAYDRPRPDQLPDGWGVMGWNVTISRGWMDEHYEIECTFGHIKGARVDLRAELKPGAAIDFAWVRRYLEAVTDVPGGIRVDTELETHWWNER